MDGELSDAEYEAFEARLRQETKLQGLLAEARGDSSGDSKSSRRTGSLGAEDSGDG